MTDAVIVEAIRQAQSRIRLTGNHRYQHLVNDRWEYVLGTTSIIKTLAAPALIDWAARLAAETGDPKAHQKVRDDTADKGHNLHSLIERECRQMMGETVAPIPASTEDELQALARWQKWARDVELKPLAVEFRVIDARLGYAGTIDFFGYICGARKVADWKSGNSVWPEHHLQNVAYRSALGAMLGIDPPAGHLVRVPRDGDRVTEKPGTSNVAGTMRAFEGLLNTYLWQRDIKREMRETEAA